MTGFLTSVRTWRHRRIVALIAFGFLPALIAAVASARAFDAWWYVGEAALATVALAAGSLAAGPRGKLLARAFTWVALALMVGVTAVFLASLLGWSGVPTRRFVLGFSTPILLGDSLVILAIVLWVLRLVRSPWVLLLGFVAQAATGTRTSWMAIAGAAIAAYLVSRRGRPWLKMLVVVTVIALAVGTGIVLSRGTGNLLSASGDLRTGVWNLSYARVTATPIAVHGPAAARRDAVTGMHVTATRDASSQYPSLILIQKITTSQLGEPYVASVYLRSDQPTNVILGSGVGKRLCSITTRWSRCDTPARPGNGHTLAAFTLQFPPSVDHVSFDMWGPQLEQATVPGAVHVTSRLTVITSVLNRFRNPTSIVNRDIDPRLATMAAAWSMFIEHPWSGVGLQGWAHAYARTRWAHSYPGLPDSHNQVLYALATGSIWALIALLLPPFGAFALLRRRWRRWLPLAVGLFLITILDVTFYYSWIYVPFWFAVGFLAEERAISQDGDDASGVRADTVRATAAAPER